MATRVLIVDDHPVVRDGLRSYLDLHAELEVVDAVADAPTAVDRCRELRPDVVLLDLQLGEEHGLSAIARLRDLDPAPAVVVLTSFADEEYVRQAVRLGASGYLVKDAGPDTILEGVRAAARGEMPIDPSLVKALATRRRDPIEELTPRELEVLQLVAQGRSNRDISEALFITEKTVKSHVGAILSKLDLESRTQAAVYAKDHGL